MKKALFLSTLFACLYVPTLAAQDLAIRADRLHTMAGAPMEDAVILVTDGKIAAIGKAGELVIPTGVRTLRAAVVSSGAFFGGLNPQVIIRYGKGKVGARGWQQVIA